MQHTRQENVENLRSARIRTGPSEPFPAGSQTVDLGSLQLIVCVGRGIKDAENIPIVPELAASGIADDLFEVVPALTVTVKAANQ
jgi:electron transfer flavoprotein alpha subunit